MKNALITGTHLGLEDHGIPTCFLQLRFEGCSQGFGGYDLRHYGINFVLRILEVVGVTKWEDLKGKLIRIETDGTFGKIKAIGNIMEDKWFNPEQEEADANLLRK